MGTHSAGTGYKEFNVKKIRTVWARIITRTFHMFFASLKKSTSVVFCTQLLRYSGSVSLSTRETSQL